MILQQSCQLFYFCKKIVIFFVRAKEKEMKNKMETKKANFP